MTKDFYDNLSSVYHLIFQDWEASIARQAGILKTIISAEWGEAASTVLDVSCGIGTQAIGLAQAGYRVAASDISEQEVQRAKREAEKRGLEIDFSVADMREAFAHHQKQVDVVISCDNSVPHLLSDAEILQAFREFYRCVRPGGGCLITLRDYARESREPVQVRPYGIRVDGGRKNILLQTWEFHGEIYDLTMYLIRDEGQPSAETQVFRTQYYAVSLSRIIELLEQAGFTGVHQVQSEFYQPVITGTRR